MVFSDLRGRCNLTVLYSNSELFYKRDKPMYTNKNIIDNGDYTGAGAGD
jgi:hypothetical protein